LLQSGHTVLHDIMQSLELSYTSKWLRPQPPAHSGTPWQSDGRVATVEMNHDNFPRRSSPEQAEVSPSQVPSLPNSF
jgi:hypothetical protein